MAKNTKSENVPKAMQETYEKVVSLTDDFCQKYLNDEYAQTIRYATAALCRKRPSPLQKGRVKSWACGITYAIGSVNFLFDRSQTPSMSAGELCEKFGVSTSTGAAKSKEVRDALDTYQLDPDWCVPSNLDDNPRVWMISVNGFLMDVRQAPRRVQELAYEKGIIPYIPDDKK